VYRRRTSGGHSDAGHRRPQASAEPTLLRTGSTSNVRSVSDTVLPGDLNVGDVIVLPGGGGEVVVETIQLGHGVFVVTVSDLGSAVTGAARVITLTAATRVSRRGYRRTR
jgi:hypothetical protein